MRWSLDSQKQRLRGMRDPKDRGKDLLKREQSSWCPQTGHVVCKCVLDELVEWKRSVGMSPAAARPFRPAAQRLGI